METLKPTFWNTNSRHPELQRVPTWTTSIEITANTWQELHTPSAGTTFRLMGGVVSWDAAYTCAARNQLSYFDGQGAGFNLCVGNIGTTSPSGGNIVWNLPGNGFLGALADRKLYFKIGTALTTGVIQVTSWGCDE